MYGGAAGGGKTDALIALALRWADHPKHRALMLRRTRPQLQEVIDRTLQLYPDIVPGAVWREAESRWKFPSGAIIQMGYAEHEQDILNFKTFEYNLICFDELTSFTEKQYLFMFLRNRTKAADLPPLIRSGTNPGDIGHEWVFRRFIDKRQPYQVYNESVDINSKPHVISRQYIPSHVWDNPAMPNRDEYVAGIMQMAPEDVAAYLHGEWSRLAGAMFQPLVEAEFPQVAHKQFSLIRCIDFGISDPTCVLWLVHYPATGITDVVSELYLRDPSLDDVATNIKIREKQLGLGDPVYSVGSPEMFNRQATSGQSIATMLSTLGVSLEKGNIDRMAGWARLRTLQQRLALRVWPDYGNFGAPNLKRTLPMLQRNTGLGKDPNDLRPRQEDHSADALRYGIMVIYERPEVVLKPEPPADNPNKDIVFDKMMLDIRKQSKKLFIPDLGTWDF
jgi:terminase large subunit-like protein